MSDTPIAPSFWRTVLLVASREVRTRLRSRAFLGMFAILVACAAAATILPNVISSTSPEKVAVIGTPPVDLTEVVDGDGTAYVEVIETVSDRAAGEALLREDEVDAVLDFSGGSLTVIGLREPPGRAIDAFSTAPAVELIDQGKDPALGYFVSVAFGVLFFLAASLFGTQIAQSVVEEKSTRIVEILLSTISARALLTGKVLGSSVLAIGQIVVLAAVALTGLAVTGDAVTLSDLGAPILWFVGFFTIGFVMVASMFAATASLVSRAEEIGSATAPVTTLIMVPYLLTFVATGNETLSRVLAWIPFSAPISMPALVFTGDARWWEPFGSLAVLVLTTVVVLAIGERVYRNALLRTGSRVKLGDAVRGAVASRR